MQEEEFTFVTLDNSEAIPADAIVIDVEDGGFDLGDAVVVDNNSADFVEQTDIISLDEDTVMLSDTDTMDLYSTDMGDADITIIL